MIATRLAAPSTTPIHLNGTNQGSAVGVSPRPSAATLHTAIGTGRLDLRAIYRGAGMAISSSLADRAATSAAICP